MIGTVVTVARPLLVRGLTVAAVVLTYAAGSVVTHVLGVVGVSGLALAVSATPAKAWCYLPPCPGNATLQPNIRQRGPNSHSVLKYYYGSNRAYRIYRGQRRACERDYRGRLICR
jgi:hypothetical protein